MLLLSAGAAAPAAPTDRPVMLPDGRTLNLYCQGRRGPVVVLDSGWSADSRAWSRVLAALPDTVRACAVDRAGQGRSSPGPLPRDGEAVARDLHMALSRGQVPGPWVMVGHSLGGLNMRHFARLFPKDVAGLLLVDPTTPTMPGAFAGLVARARACVDALSTDSFPAERPDLDRCRADDRTAARARWEVRLSEIESAGNSTSAGLADQGLGSLTVPLIVLRPGPAEQPAQGFTDPLAALSTRGEARLVPGSGHMMMIDRPDAVVGAIIDIVSKAAEPASSDLPERPKS